MRDRKTMLAPGTSRKAQHGLTGYATLSVTNIREGNSLVEQQRH